MKSSSTQGSSQARVIAAKPLIKSMKKVPSQLIKEQTSGKSIIEQQPKPKIIQFLNIGDSSIHIDSQVDVDEPLFSPEPTLIQFTNYEPLQTKEQILKLRNKDKVARSIKIIPPDSKLFSVTPAKKNMVNAKKPSASMTSTASDIDQMSTKVAPGMEISYIIKFSPEAKTDYAYDLMIVTEREKFIVPIRARGCRAMLDFPDQLDFGLVPVKFETEKPVMIRNIGEKATKWHIRVPQNFKLDKNEGILEIGQTDQLIFHFVPQEARKYSEELFFSYDGLEADIPIIGEAHNDNVYLSKSHIHTDPTSITLFSHQYFEIVNKSTVPIEFSWRAFATQMEEQAKKQRLNQQLTQEEVEERDEIENTINHEDDGEELSLDSDDSYDAKELEERNHRKKQKILSTLSRKYTSIKKAVDEDKMLFQDEIFQIEPLEGKIWPNTEMTCCVTFRPQGPYHYSCTAFANVTCNQERLSLNLTGQGKGPQAQLSITEMDIGDIFVTNKKTFELGIENTGEIDCVWKLIPYETPFGSKFKFSETGGKLGVKDHVRDLLKVTFQSDILGEFSETFRFALEGSSEMLTLTFKGHVVAPTFRFSEDIIDFGRVSYKFSEKKTVQLTNTSEVDINYVIRVPGDGRTLQNEFNIKNDRGRLAADKTAQVVIEFTPCFQQTYDMVLVVDLEGVGQDMLAIPIRADCLVPKVNVMPKEYIDYDKVFLKHAKFMDIQIINEDSLRAKFEIVAQDEQSKRIALYEPDIQSGIIQPHSTQIVRLSLKTEILGTTRVQVYIKLDGHHIPTMLTIVANSIGPIVELDKHEIDFGSKEVLIPHTEKIKIKNSSEIEAEYTAFTKQKESIWKVVQRHDILKPGEEKTIEVVCIADEVQKFTDTLHIIVSNGHDEEVQLAVRGTGSTLYCKELKELKEQKDEATKEMIKAIDFGTEYTHKNVAKQFFLENRGRKPMKIIWARQNKKEKKKQIDLNPKDSKQTQTKLSSEKEPDEVQVFNVIPETITLNPKMGIMVEIRANSTTIGKIIESWQCQVLVGADRKPKPVYFANILGNFITPTLQFNFPKLDFKYLWEKGVPSMPIARDLTIKNTSPLITTISLKIDPPFSCPVEKLTLEKDAIDTVKIEFDPGMKQDRVSDHINGKMLISHEGHPHKDTVQLQGEVCFPNLQILPPKIEFGCILNDTSKKKYLVLTNISEMAVAYEWSFLEDAPLLNEQDEIDHQDQKGKKKKKKKALPINEVFDILPVSGILQPGQTENVEFTFYAGSGLNYTGMAVCSVDGGPDYDVPIAGDSSFINHRLSAYDLDFGEIAYNESTTKDFYIENVGKVPFEFNINLQTISRPGIVECTPTSGKVVAGEKYKINVKFFPGIPDNIHEMFLVECGHFPAERFTVKAVGIYPAALLSLPRADEESYQIMFDSTKLALENHEIRYSAMFKGIEAVKQMPSIPPKFVEKEKIVIKDPVVLEIDAEVDRLTLCEKIVQKVHQNAQLPMFNDLAHTTVATQSLMKQATAKTEDVILSKEQRTNVKGKPQAPEKTVQATKPNIDDLGSMSNTLSKIGSGQNFHSINIATYTCDFGNIIVGKAVQKSFRLTNCGKIPINFNFDKKLLNFAGIVIEPDKAQKVMPNQSILFKVVMQTRKTSKFGRARYLIPVDIKNGPQYTIDFTANLTIPEISMSNDTLDFDRVCVNTRKTVKIRLENNKDVTCEWFFPTKQEGSILSTTSATGVTASTSKSGRDDSEKFQVWPQNGVLLPGQRQSVDIMFTPSSDKPYVQKLAFKCNQNQKSFILNVKGQGINFAVDMVPETIQLGPVLPYDSSAIQAFEIRNPMEQAIEIYSLDFDKQYLEEEEILKRIDLINPQSTAFSGEPLYLPLRKPGSEFWSSIKQQDEKKLQQDALKLKIKVHDDKLAELQKNEDILNDFERDKHSRAEKPEEFKDVPVPTAPTMTQDSISNQKNLQNEMKAQLEAQLAELVSDNLEVNLPPALKEEKRDNIILLGPRGCGKTTAANFLSQEQQRGLIRVDQLVDFWQKRGGALADETTAYLEQRNAEMEAAIAELEKQKKAKKPKKGEEEIKINPAEYKYLPKELIVSMIQKRLQEEDCNAGSLFDCLTSENWPDEKFAIRAIWEACGRQNVQLVLFSHLKQKPDEQEEEDPKFDVCVNYRYAQRHDPDHFKLVEDKPQKLVQKESADVKGKGKVTQKNATVQSKLAKTSSTKGKETKIEGETSSKKITPEEEKLAKDLETKRKRAENLQKSGFKPPLYSEDEKNIWKKQIDDYYTFFADLINTTNAANTDKENLKYGSRKINEQSIHYDLLFTCEDLKKIVLEPQWPNPDKEPLPPPLINSIQKRPPTRPDRLAITNFAIWTPISDERPDSSIPPSSKDGKEHQGVDGKTDKQTRWVLAPKESKTLYVKFYSTKTGVFKQDIQFEIVGSYKPFTLQANAICEFPTINQNPRNLFLQQKKVRPTTEPESYLSKVYVNSEGVFDFGPLLIGKNAETRKQDKVKAVNGTFFQITNNGKYDVDLNFTLRSTLPAEEGGPTEKSPFIIEPSEASLKVDETLNLQVFAFPDEAKLYKDEVIVLMKNNPNPTILNIQCLGAKPIVNVDTETVKFERALIGKNPEKDLCLRNDCAIPVNWKLTGVDKLSKEFNVSPIEGTLQPCKDVHIKVKFDAKTEKKFVEQIHLQVEDVEGFHIKQEEKHITLDAEAFNITLNDAMQVEQFLDFGAVRVGEPKEQTLYLKNQGLYPIRYEFKMKKATTQAMFTIEPMEGVLSPNEDKNIIFKFLSHKEIKLTRAKNLSDITLVILEGDQKLEHQQIPILVEVNAVYSKFSISPLRNLNFGPMQFSEHATRTFEIRNEGLFDFKYNICDFANEEEKKKISDERQKEMEARLAGADEEVKDDPKSKNAKKPVEVKKPPVKGAKGAEVIPDGTVVNVSQYAVSPAVGTIAPGSASIITVVFNAQGAKFYESNLLIDIANRDSTQNPEGIQFQLCAESNIPGINTTDFDQIFEEQTVIPSLDPAVNTQTVISSSIYSIQEKLFWFGTLIASKNPEGCKERFKIMNPNKIPCTIKFTVKPRTQSKSEGFAFDVSPDGLTIDPHKHKYVTVGFYPTAMMQYSGIFEGIVEHGNDETKQGRLTFELRGEGTLPTLQIQKPSEADTDGTACLRFKKVRIGKELILPIILKNEGQVAATARFDAITNEAFTFEGNMNQTISAKSFHNFEIKFKPTKAAPDKFMLTFSTMNNLFEQHKVLLQGEGFMENIIFEGLPNGSEDELGIGDCIIGKAKAVTFQLVNNGEKDIKFRWNAGDKDEFKFFPQVGHLKAKSNKTIKIMIKGIKTAKYENISLTCETSLINQKADGENKGFNDWDDTMKTLRMVRPSEFKKIMQERNKEENKRKEEAEAAANAAAGKKAVKAPAAKDKKAEVVVVEEDVVVNMDEEPTTELIEVITEPEFTKVEGQDKNIVLKASCVIDYANFNCDVKQVDFKPTLMYASRSYKYTIKNTSLINLNYNFKIVNASTAVLDAGPYTIIPKKGSIAPDCDENFIIKFSPLEVENDFSRLLSANIQNLNPGTEPLCIELGGIADRPIIHFELAPPQFVKADKEGLADCKVVEFISLGTNIRNTKRFMTTNPTSQGYEFEWEEILDEKKKQKPAFKCMTSKGLILSGKKAEMVFEYTPDTIGEHESRWMFKIPSENITQQFLVIGKVSEPNIMFESGKLKFGPLLINGSNKETFKIINQEHIPFAFNFSKESIRGSSDYGDSLSVNPISGVVPALSDLPIEITFQPKFELTYNYNLVCNVKRKARPLVLNVKGEGYKIHHSVRVMDTPPIIASSDEPTNLNLGEFFINEKKTRIISLTNNGEFNFDFVWKRQVNKYVTITPETGTVKTGNEVKVEIIYLPIAEHEMKNYKSTLSIVSGPRYEFQLNGKARRPGVKLNQNIFDFGPCFVTGNPTPIKKMLYITNLDKQALTIETNFEKKTYLDFQVTPGQVLMPNLVVDEPQKKEKDAVKPEPKTDQRFEVPIIFTPREIKKYHEVIKLDFNGLYQIDVVVKGQGIPMLLDLKDPDQAFTDIGAVSVNSDVTKIIPIMNRSAKAIKFRVEPANKDKFNKCALTISPDEKTDIILKPKESIPIEIRFRPKTRLANFEHEIHLKIEGMEEKRKILSLLGAAHGIELKIMDEQIAFGSVVKDSRLTKNLQMSNFGDVKANFSWDKKAFGEHFTISPASGYINPNSNLDLDITFHPKSVDNAISAKISCTVQGGEPLSLNLMGKSVKQEGNDSLKLDFKSVVRKQVTQNVTIQNTEEKEWTINPTISTSSDVCKGYFLGKPTFIVPPKSSAQFEVVYCPKTMTKKEQKPDSAEMIDIAHKGSLFFPLPNGTALLYNLNGIATEPTEEGTITQTVTAKKQKNFLIKVQNPFKITQRFTASWKVENVEKAGLFIRGSNLFDVDSEGSKEYKLNFLALKTGVYKFRVTFLIKDSGEYMFYNFAITVEDSQEIEEITLISPIREVITHQVVLENPTDQEVKIERSQFTMNHESIELQPDSFILKPQESKEFTIRYRPLMITDKDETMIVLKNPVIGDYKFKLFLRGIAPTSQRSLAFKCSLGQDQMQPFKFQHFLKKLTVYTVKVERIDGPGICDFKAEVATVSAPIAENQKGVEISVNVRYEPYTIGDSRALLKVTSPEGMEYTCMLFGKSNAPQPQGPIKVPPGAKPIGIDFKNPLNEKVEFTCVFDNPNFSLASKPAGLLDPGKATNFQIAYAAKADLPRTGRMIVSTKGLPPWIYYLQGE